MLLLKLLLFLTTAVLAAAIPTPIPTNATSAQRECGWASLDIGEAQYMSEYMLAGGTCTAFPWGPWVGFHVEPGCTCRLWWRGNCNEDYYYDATGPVDFNVIGKHYVAFRCN